MTISHFEHFHFTSSSRLLWPVHGRLPTQIKWLCSQFLSTSSVYREKLAGFDRAAPAARSNHFLWGTGSFLHIKLGIVQQQTELLPRVRNVSLHVVCALLHCLPLPHLRRTQLQLLFSQSTPLPPARLLTRWRGRLHQVVVVVPTQVLLLNLWPTRLNLTLHAHRAVPACSSHRMGR